MTAAVPAGVISRSATKALAMAAVLLSAPGPAVAETYSCSTVSAVVEARTEALAKPVCKAIAAASATLAKCGVRQSAPVSIRVYEQGLELWGIPVYGAFDAERKLSHVTDFKHCHALQSSNAELCKLDPAEFYLSVLAHETAHAIVQQVLGDKTLGLVSAEYVAFAVQLAVMPEEFRRQFLAAFELPERVDLADLRQELLFLSPFLFAAMAYRHFATETKPCQTLNAIIDGSIKLE